MFRQNISTGTISRELSVHHQNTSERRFSLRSVKELKYPFQGSHANESRQIKGLQLKHQLANLHCFNNDATVTFTQLEEEMAYLIALSEDPIFWAKCREDEKLLIEKYKLAIMKTTEECLLNRYARANILTPSTAVKKPTKVKWSLYIGFLLLETIPMIWGAYSGIFNIVSSIPGLTQQIISTTTIGVCALEAVLYYAGMGPVLKKALGIASDSLAKPKEEVYGQQLEILKRLDHLLVTHNKMSALAYEQSSHLCKLFSKNLRNLQDFEIYLASNLESIRPKIVGKAMIIVGQKAYFAKDGQLMMKNGLPITVIISNKKLNSLNEQSRDREGKIPRTKSNGPLLDRLITKHTSCKTFHDETKIKPYQESSLKKGLRWILSFLHLLLNLTGGYFLAVSLVSATAATAALAGTPLGWTIIGLLMFAQIALRLALRSKAMNNLLNPTAEKHDQIREEINLFHPNDRQYDETLKVKNKMEQLQIKKREANNRLYHYERAARVRSIPYLDASYRVMELPTLSASNRRLKKHSVEKLELEAAQHSSPSHSSVR